MHVEKKKFRIPVTPYVPTMGDDERAKMIGWVQQFGHALNGVENKDLLSDVEVVTRAVAFDWRALMYASAEAQANKGVVMAAVHKCGSALAYASLAMKDDPEVQRSLCPVE